MSPSSRATLIGLLAVLCWSGTLGLMRSVAEALGPVGGAATIFSVSAALLAVRGLPLRVLWQQASRVYLLAGGLLFVAYEVCLALAIGLAQTRGQAMELAMINYLWPSLTIAFAVALRKQHARWWLWAALAVCMYGLWLVLAAGGAQAELGSLQNEAGAWLKAALTNARANPLAYGLAFLAALLWPAYSLLAREFGRGADGVPVFLLAVALALWLQWLLGPQPLMQWSVGVALQALVIGALTALGYTCWDYGVQRGHLAVLAAGSYFTPVLSALLASVWLAVQPGALFWQGVLLICAGSLLCWLATRGR